MRNFAQVDVKLPDLGEGTKEATLKEWYVKVGDHVEEFDDLCEVFTDKLVAKIPSTATGKVVSINYDIDDMPQTGHTLIQIETDGSEAAEVDHSAQ
jgi:2-oxoisovalerate dehydrogenase E2 component (dihydrolipoyl transacylase)